MKEIITSTLHKGDTFSAAQLEMLFDAPRESKAYRLQLIGLQTRIQDESNTQNRPLLCKTEQDCLIIMTDLQASVYKAYQHRQAIRKLYRTLRHQQRVDIANLSKEETKNHEKEIINQSRIVQVVKRERRRTVL